MQLNLLKSKILRAEVTDAHVDYEGSLAIDEEYMQKIGLLAYEKILVANISNGERLETYAIPAPVGSRAICLNGAAAHRGKAGDLLVIMSFCQVDAEEAKSWKPKVIVLGEHNQRIIKDRTGASEVEELLTVC